MTSPKTQIQALINKIDEVLDDSNAPRSSTQPAEGIPQQQVLEQARNYLASLQGSSISPISPERPRPEIAQQEWWRDRPPTTSIRPANPVATGEVASPSESAQQVLQAIVQEMNYLRVNMMQPMREELMGLYQQRQFLTADIQRLEQQRHQLLLSQQQINQQQVINDFTQSLMGRLQEQLAAQITQSFENAQFQASQNAGLMPEAPVPQLNSGDSVGQTLTPSQRFQQMQLLQSRSDEMLTKLDSTLRVVFESLQNNLDSYQDSLGQGLSKMHGLGQQGEAMFSALVNRLAEQLGRGASQYIQTSISPEWELPGLQSGDNASASKVSPRASSPSNAASVPDELPEDQIDRMLNSLEPGNFKSSESESKQSDDLLIDDLLAELPQSTGSESVDFNLDDLQLPIDDNLMGAIANADESASSENEPGSSFANDEMVTLFAIEEDGVVDQVDDQRLNQLEENDTDLFLHELNELTSSSEADRAEGATDSESWNETTMSAFDAGNIPSDLDRSQALDQGGAFSISNDSDEALAFLDQIATDIESDLTSESVEETTEEGFSDSADSYSAQSSIDESSAPTDEIDNVYQMFDEAVTPGLSPNSDLDWQTDEESLSDADTLEMSPPRENSADPDDDAIAPAFLDDLLFEDVASVEQPSEAELNSETTYSAAEDQIRSGENPFPELGITTQENVDDSSEMDSEQIETIRTLSELGRLDQPDATQKNDDWVEEPSDSLQAESNPAGADFERYVMASPNEDLLASDDSDAVAGSNLKLDSTTMQRLASDLSGFEGIDESEVLLPSEEDLDESFTEDIGQDERSPDSELDDSELDTENPNQNQQNPADTEASFDEMQTDGFEFDIFESIESSDSDSSDIESEMSAWDDLDADNSMSDSLFTFSEDEDEGDFTSGFSEADATTDEQVESEPSVTVDDLFSTAPSDSTSTDDGFEEQLDPLDSDELRQIFEDLKALDNDEIEPSPGTQEQTLVDLLKGVNPPSLPEQSEAGGEPTSSAETDTSWSIFDDLNTSGSSTESDQKKNSDSV